MSLTTLLAAYDGPTGDYQVAIDNGDDVAVTRIRTELAAAVRDEILPVAITRSIAGTEWENTRSVYRIVFAGRGPMADEKTADATIHIVPQRFYDRIKQIINYQTIGAESLAKLRGEYPTATGVLDAETAIYPGTMVWVVTPNAFSIYQNKHFAVISDDGVGEINVQAAAPKDIPRHHVHFEYLEGELDLTTAAFMDTIAVNDTVNDGVDDFNVNSIDYDARTVELQEGVSAPITVTFTVLQADYTKV